MPAKTSETAGRRVVVLTGAGVSADSGVATFRGAGGLWEGQRLEDVATPEAWARDPAQVWRFYQQRRAQLHEVEPNAAHRALAQLERELAADPLAAFTLVTQNVDDLHQRAGSKPLCMHGELSVLTCERCGHRERNTSDLDPQRFVPCASCGYERLRPDVVWFGEQPYHLEAIEQAVCEASCFVAIGTSGQVYPAAGYLQGAREWGARTIVASLDEPENLGSADEYRAGRACESVPRLVEELLAGG